MKPFFTLICLLLLLPASKLFCQQAKSFPFQFYSDADGLSSNNSFRLVQDQLGFIWIATQDGLNMFDGRSFKIFRKKEAGSSIIDNAVADLALQINVPKLWIAYPYSGLQAIDISTHCRVDSIPERLLNHRGAKGPLTRLSFADSKFLWVGHAEGWLVIDVLQHKIVYSSLEESSLPYASKGYVIDILHSPDGYTWVITRNGYVHLYNSSNYKLLNVFHFENSPGQLYQTQINEAIEMEDGKILLATNKGIHGLHVDRRDSLIKKYQVPSALMSLQNESIRNLYTDSNKNIWIACNSRLLLAEKEKLYSVKWLLAGTGDDWTSGINMLFTDRFLNLWVATKHGLYTTSLNPTPFTAYRNSYLNFNSHHVYNIYSVNNSLLLYAADEGIFKVDVNSGLVKTVSTEIAGDGIFEGPKNELILSDHNGLWVWNGDTLQKPIAARKKYKELSLIKNEYIATSLKIGDSAIVFGSDKENGVFWWNHKKHYVTHIATQTTPIQLSENTVNFLSTSIDNKSMLAGGDRYITAINIDNKKTRTFEIKDHKYFFDIKAIGNDYYIASYESGILITDTAFRIKKIISSSNGLTDNGVYRIEKEGDTAIWVSTNNGLNRISLRENTIRRFFKEAGLHGNTFEEFSSCSSATGVIYMGGVGGITAIQPAKLQNTNNESPLFFTLFRYHDFDKTVDSVNLTTNHFSFPANAEQFTIGFSTPDYKGGSNTFFQYKIEPLQKNWVNLEDRNQINFLNIEPGSYTLSLRASQSIKPWSEPKVIALEFAPKWYQTILFKILLFALLASIIYAIFKFRINQIKKEHTIRSRLASDLHDDLGSTINSVKVYTELALLENKDATYLQKVKASTQEAITGLRDLIWVLDDNRNSVEQLLARVNYFAAPLCAATGIIYNYTITPEVKQHELQPDEKRNLQMMLKEIINNAIKYANASRIDVTMELIASRPFICVSDNGKGFDQTTVTEGNGLKNLRRRAQEIKYKLIVETSTGSGTSFKFYKT